MKCMNCKAELPDGAKFCAECGHSTEAAPVAVFCSNCGAALAPDERFCSNCGARCGTEATVPSKTEGKGKLSRLLLCVGGILAAAALVFVLFSLFSGKSGAQVVYLKDAQLHHLYLQKKAEPREVTKRLEDATSSVCYNYTRFTEDGKKLFYPDRADGNTYTLYMLDTSSPKSESVKIDSGLTGYYKFNEDGDRVAYLKDEKLYLHNLKEKTKIAGDVADFYISKDGKSLLYLSGDSGDYRLYLKKGSKEEVKIASGVTTLVRTNGDFSVILYRKDDNLYICKNGREPEKIASDVNRIWQSYDSGACYFTKEEDRVSYWSLMTDDVGGEDSSRVKSNYADSYTDNPVSQLYYFDGKECIKVTEYARSILDSHVDGEKLVISALPDEELPQIRVSELLEGNKSISTMVADAYGEASKVFLLNKGKLTELALEDVNHLQFSHSGKKILAAIGMDKEIGTFTLVEAELSGDAVKSVTQKDEDVFEFAYLSESDDYIYLKASDDAEDAKLQDLYQSNSFDLYHNGEKICEEATRMITWSKNGKQIFYLADYDSDDYSATLYCWDGKNSTKIQSDVYAGEITVIKPGQILFLRDYSTKNSEGDMTVWKGNKITKLDKDVQGIIRVYLP